MIRRLKVHTLLVKCLLASIMPLNPGIAAAEEASKAKPKQTQTKPLSGKHVTLRYGPGFSKLSAMVIRDSIINQGCPATLHDDGPFNNAIDVEIGEDWETFESSGSAASYALTVCKK